jgi:16S rRNA (adenine1518-N6/adenine1519-N6)-dimethyltransferase
MAFPRAKKSFGQHFLADQSVLAKIVKAAEIVPGETVLEIGPGTGILTQALLDAGAHVVAIEVDRDMVATLYGVFGDRIVIKQADVLSLSDKEIEKLVGGTYKLVANLPYNVGTAVVERFLSIPHRPDRLVVMLQKEVADRMAAKPPKMSVLSVACQLYADCERLFVVPPGAFRPPPKVDSAVVRLDPKPVSADAESVIALAKAAFASKRKQLQGNLAQAGVADAATVKQALKAIGYPENARAETISVRDWVRLFDILNLTPEA